MSYVPIYNKLQELDTRLSTLENAPKPEVSTLAHVAASVVAPIAVPDLASLSPETATDVFEELNRFKTNYVNLLNECNPLSNRIAILSSTVATLATKDELPDVSVFATKAELPDVSVFATKAELPDVSVFATKDELPDVSVFATKAELPDVSVFATKAELPDVSVFASFATKVDLAELYIKFENAINVIAQLNTKIDEANEKIAALEAA